MEFLRQAVEVGTWKCWQLVNTHPGLNRMAGRMAGLLGRRLPNIGPLRAWRRYRAAPQAARKSLHQLAEEHGVRND